MEWTIRGGETDRATVKDGEEEATTPAGDMARCGTALSGE
jgi:hypothetical protein